MFKWKRIVTSKSGKQYITRGLTFDIVNENRQLLLDSTVSIFSFNDNNQKVVIMRDQIDTIEFRKTIFGW